MTDIVGMDLRADGPREHPAAEGASKKRRRNSEATRRDILSAASQRFSRRSYAQVTLKDIADDVGVTPALIAHYFGTKQALFEMVAKGSHLSFPPFEAGDRKQQLIARARAALRFYQEDESLAGVALLRSLDFDDGALFRAELEKRMAHPWSAEVTGPGAEIRLKLIAGVLLGVGMFSLGALTDPDRPKLSEDDAEYLVHYLAEIFAVCVDG